MKIARIQDCTSTPRRFAGLLALALALAVGCAGTPTPKATPEDIANAERAGTLETLYERLAGEVEALDPESRSFAEAQESLAAVGARLATKLDNNLRAELEAARVGGDGPVPIEALARAEAAAAPMERWDAERYAALSARIQAERGRTENEVAKLRSELGSLSEAQALQRLEILESLGEMAGAGTPAQAEYTEQRLEIVEQLKTEVKQKLEEEDLDAARALLADLVEVAPDDTEVGDSLVELDARVFERDFWAALERGDADAAYASFTTLAGSTSFESLRPKLEGSAGRMADYFAALADAETAEGDLASAYRLFDQARQIELALGHEPGTRPEQQRFVKGLDALVARASKANRPGLAWIYIQIIEDLAPSSPDLIRRERSAREKVFEAATPALALSFDDDDEAAGEVGKNIASQVVQQLLTTIPDDVRIVEREEFEAFERERGLAGSGGGGTLASADFMLRGTVLEAKVDTSEQKGRKTLRVVTEQVQEPNPKHQWWMGLSSDEREKTPEPPETVTRPRKEDISFGVTIHRKVGLLSASYRLVDFETSKVLFADSARRTTEHQDESREGIELGDFSMPFKLADLPSDTEILTQLADEVSTAIAERLAAELKDPEEDYKRTAKRLADEGNFVSAGEQAAYAQVLSERKERTAEEFSETARVYAMEASRSL